MKSNMLYHSLLLNLHHEPAGWQLKAIVIDQFTEAKSSLVSSTGSASLKKESMTA
jgi:hypothetical protein